MWRGRSNITKAVIAGAFLAALAGLSVLVWAVASPGSDDEPLVIDATTDDHLVYLLGPDEITVVDPGTRETVQTIATEYDPEITIAPDGSAVYLTENYLTDGQFGDKVLSVIDTRTWQVVDQLPATDRIDNIGVGSSGMAVSADGRYVYIHKWELLEGQDEGPNGSVPASDHWWDIFDTATQEFSDNPPHVPACGIAQVFPPLNGSSSLAVLCYQRNALVFVDLPSGEVTGSITSRDRTNGNICALGDTSVAAAVQAPEGTIYLVTTAGCVRVIDPAQMAVRETFTLGLPADWRIPYGLITLSPAGDRLMIGVGPGSFSEDDSAEAWVIDLKMRSLLSTFPLHRNAWSLAVSPDGALLYVAGYESSLTAYDIATGEQAWDTTDVGAPWIVSTAPRP